MSNISVYMMRAEHFERLVLNKIRLCCQGAFDSWYNNAKDRALQASCISKLRQWVDTKSFCFCLETWHNHSMFARLARYVGRFVPEIALSAARGPPKWAVARSRT